MADLLELLITLLKLIAALFVILSAILLVLTAAGMTGYIVGVSRNRGRRPTYLIIARLACFVPGSLGMLLPGSRIVALVAWPLLGCALAGFVQVGLAIGATRRDREDTAERIRDQLRKAFGTAIADIEVVCARDAFSVTGRAVSPDANPSLWQTSIRRVLESDGYVTTVSISAPVDSSPAKRQ